MKENLFTIYIKDTLIGFSDNPINVFNYLKNIYHFHNSIEFNLIIINSINDINFIIINYPELELVSLIDDIIVAKKEYNYYLEILSDIYESIKTICCTIKFIENILDIYTDLFKSINIIIYCIRKFSTFQSFINSSIIEKLIDILSDQSNINQYNQNKLTFNTKILLDI